MKRLFTILLAAVVILSTFAATIMDAAATTPADAEELYLSDIRPVSWKMIDDGATPGYNAFHEDGTPLRLAGVTYEKGLSTHPGYTFDAEFVYDISDYDYTTFTAIVGKTDRYAAALPGSFTSFHVYVDGVLADEIIDLVAGDTYAFNVDVAGSSELKLVTGGGSDNITCDGAIWANAKLDYGKADSTDPSLGTDEDLYLSDILPRETTAFDGPYYDKNAQGEPLLLDGVTYKKGFWTHPMPDKEVESVYNISRYAYNTFYAIVGKEQKYANALPGSLTTYRVYVDGVLADEAVDLVAGDTHVFRVNVAGASELKLVTGFGSDDYTCDGSIWGDAKLTVSSADCEEHVWDEGRVTKELSCTVGGQMRYQCKNCIQVKTEDIAPSHAASLWEIGEQPNCTETGTKVQRCSACGEIVNTTAWDAKGHIPGVWLTTKHATCTEVGIKTQTCQRCDTVLAEEEIPAAGHFFGAWGNLDGKQVRVCECGEQEEKAAWTPLLCGGIAVIVLLAAGVVAFLLIKKKDKVNKRF
jgi:hypothetical protein